MMLLSVRAKEAIKTGLAMTIAFGLALGMGWDKPSWAGFAVAIISLSTAGQSLNKGLLRMLGTVVAATVALTLIAVFAQERRLFMIALSIYLGICTYMLTGNRYQYFWYVSGFVCLVIAVGAGPTGESAFHTAILRTQETGLGILVYSLVSVFLWAQRSGGALEAVPGGVLDAQHRVFQAYSAAIGKTAAEQDARALQMQQVQVLNQFRATLAGAEADTRDVWEARRRWSTFDGLATNLGEALERWRASFLEVEDPDVRAFHAQSSLSALRGVVAVRKNRGDAGGCRATSTMPGRRTRA